MDQHTNPDGRTAQAGQLAAPALQDVAWWLLRPKSMQDQHVDAVSAAAEDAYTHLRVRLVVSLGALGFDALWLRALQLALRQTVSEGSATALPTLAPGTSGINQLGDQRDAQELHNLLHALFTNFFGLLVTFIGEKLTLQIIQQLWPALASDEAGSHIKEQDHD